MQRRRRLVCVSGGCDSREQLLLGVLGLELDLEAGGGDLAGVFPLFQQVLHGVAVLRVGRDELLARVLQLKDQKNSSRDDESGGCLDHQGNFD